MGEFSTTMRGEIICPYCGHKFFDSSELNENKGGEWDEEVECENGECGKTFFCSMSIRIYYTTLKMKKCDKK